MLKYQYIPITVFVKSKQHSLKKKKKDKLSLIMKVGLIWKCFGNPRDYGPQFENHCSGIFVENKFLGHS